MQVWQLAALFPLTKAHVVRMSHFDVFVLSCAAQETHVPQIEARLAVNCDIHPLRKAANSSDHLKLLFTTNQLPNIPLSDKVVTSSVGSQVASF